MKHKIGICVWRPDWVDFKATLDKLADTPNHIRSFFQDLCDSCTHQYHVICGGCLLNKFLNDDGSWKTADFRLLLRCEKDAEKAIIKHKKRNFLKFFRI